MLLDLGSGLRSSVCVCVFLCLRNLLNTGPHAGYL